MTLSAIPLNRSGELHHDVYRYPKNEETPLYYPDGTPTGGKLVRSLLLYPGHLFQAQLDYKEIVTHDGVRYVFQRGGYVPGGAPVSYGHVRLGDLYNHLGSPVPAGDGRGAWAPFAKTVTLGVQAIPPWMLYKANENSRWNNYGDPASTYGQAGEYTYMTWSTPRGEAGDWPHIGSKIDGGGIVRALLPNTGHVNLCDVDRIHAASVDTSGARNGTVTLAYGERSGLFGWLVVAHQAGNQPVVHHIY